MSELIVERPADGVALLRLNRPEVRNALNRALRLRLGETVAVLSEDPETRAIVLTGNEEAFAAGADLKEMAGLGTVDQIRRATHRLWQPLRDCPKPLVAAIRGYALGGGLELALLCDIIIAGDGARLGLPEVRVGVMPGAGGTQRLTRAVGKYQAMRMALTGEWIGSDEALRMGLVSEVVADAETLPRALALAERIAALPPVAVAQIKEAILAGMDASLDTALALKRKSFQILFSTEDQKEGVNAFIEKRKPSFKGR